MQFHFRLMPFEEIPPWGTAQGHPNLSWFGLTLGWFWIEVGDQELFRYTRKALEHWQRQDPDAEPLLLPYEDYQVARYWEDLLEMLPAILDPLPDDLAGRVAHPKGWQDWQDRALRWQKGDEDEVAWDAYYSAVGWWERRTWDAGHLAYPPRLWLWRVGETVYVRWDNRDVIVDGLPVWEAQQGEYRLPVSEFLAAVESFHAGFLNEMGQQVDVVRAAWPLTDVEIDLDALEREQSERRGKLEPAVNPWAREVRRTHTWEQARVAIASIEQTEEWEDASLNENG